MRGMHLHALSSAFSHGALARNPKPKALNHEETGTYPQSRNLVREHHTRNTAVTEMQSVIAEQGEPERVDRMHALERGDKQNREVGARGLEQTGEWR